MGLREHLRLTQQNLDVLQDVASYKKKVDELEGVLKRLHHDWGTVSDSVREYNEMFGSFEVGCCSFVLFVLASACCVYVCACVVVIFTDRYVSNIHTYLQREHLICVYTFMSRV